MCENALKLLKVLTAITQKANTEIARKYIEMQWISRPSCVASLGFVSALGAKILQLQTDVRVYAKKLEPLP